MQIASLLPSLALAASIVFPISSTAAPYMELKTGDIVNGSIEFGRRSIALPIGKWEFLTKTERLSSTDGGVPMVFVALFEVVDKRLTRLLRIETNLQTAPWRSSWINEPCKNKGDSYWIDDRKRNFDDQYCLRVGFRSGVVDQASGDAYVPWARRIRDEGIAYSRDMPFVQVTRYGPGEWVHFEVSFNPQLSGIEPSRETSRNLNDWNGLLVDKAPDRKVFYEALREWAPRLGEAVVKAYRFEKATSDEIGAPGLPALAR